MVVLGISGRDRDAASALVADGKLVAAVAEESFVRIPGIGYEHTGGFPFGAVSACFKRAGITATDVDRIVVAGNESGSAAGRPAEEGGWATTVRRGDASMRPLADRPHALIGRLRAHAAQVLPLVGEAPARIVVLDLLGHGHGAVFSRHGHELALVRTIPGVSRLIHVAGRVADSLGCRKNAQESLQTLGAEGQPTYLDALRLALRYVRGAGMEAAPAVLSQVLSEAAREAPGSLADQSPLHVKVHTCRTNLAASLVARIAEIGCDVVSDAADCAEDANLAVSGNLFAAHRVSAALFDKFGEQVKLAPVPGPLGLALGAAASACDGVAMTLPCGLAVGPSFTESDVKEALEGCRLDYVYEPDWQRMHTRISRMLSRGKLIAWFQGSMDFGPRSLGNRSILCDPSNRYARENVNRYLRHRPDDPAPPLAMRAEQTGECLERRVCSPLGLTTVRVKPDWRGQLQASVDKRGECQVQTVMPAHAEALAELLQVHRRLSGVPALINLNLCGPCEPTACTPRDAIRTIFSSPVDALVIERFLVVKDYWLLRNDAE